MKTLIYIVIAFMTLGIYAQTPSIREKMVFKRATDSIIIAREEVQITNEKLAEFIKNEIELDIDSNVTFEAFMFARGDDGTPTLTLEQQQFLRSLDQYFAFSDEEGEFVTIQRERSGNDEIDEFIRANTVKIKDTIPASEGRFYVNYYNSKIAILKSEIKKIKEQQRTVLDFDRLAELNTSLLTKEDELDSYDLKVRKHSRSKSLIPFASRRDRATALERIFSKDNEESLFFANEAGVQFNKNGGIVESELATAYLGAIRVTFGTLLTNTNTDTPQTPQDDTAGDTMNEDDMGGAMMEEEMTGDMSDDTPADAIDAATPQTDETEAFQRLQAGGGNAYLNIELPVFYYQDRRSFLYFNIAGRAALEITELSSDVDTSTGNGSVYANLYASVSTDNDEFNFFINGSLGQYFGGSAFYERLDIEDGKDFTFGQFTTGVTIQNSIRISATLGTFSSEENLESGNVTIGVQLLSDLFKRKENR